MRAGRLKHVIDITRRVETIGEGGIASDTFTPIARLRAEIISRDARAFIAEAGEQTEAAVVFRVRFRPGIEPGDFVTMDEREFTISELKEIVARRVLELRCTGDRA
jgi:SPP1 family predicted phage head-tail adaptor